MKDLIFNTSSELTGLILRITLGSIMLPHGAQKLLGTFGGHGYKATMNFFTDTMKLPWAIAFLVIVVEFFGAVSILAGLVTRVWVLGFIAIMIGAVVTTNFRHGLFMNWFGNQSGEGYEYHLLVIGISIALLYCGSGKYSIDELIQAH